MCNHRLGIRPHKKILQFLVPARVTPFFSEQCTIVAMVRNCGMCFPPGRNVAAKVLKKKKKKSRLIAPLSCKFKDKKLK